MELVFALDLVHPLFGVRKAKHSMVEGTPPSQMPGSARIEGLSGIEFEKVIATLLERMGFHAQVTKASGDGGIDIEATLDKAIVGGRYLFQCKRYGSDNLVGAPLIRDFYGAVMSERAVKGIFITTSSFTSQAREFAQKAGLELIDGVQLQRLLSSSGLAENCDLSAVPKADAEFFEVERLTELAWRKQGDGYVLPIMHERLTLCRDFRGEWCVRGSLRGKPVEIHAQDLAGAFKAADREVMGSTELRPLFNNAWRDQQPTPKQVELCKKLGLGIPAGATRGQVSAALDVHFGRFKR